MALLLNIETATTNCSVSLSKNGEILHFIEDNSVNYSHAETLHVYVSKLLQEANVSQNQLDAIAVSKGPGSYTGLRIGVSTAKGLCYALDKPLISVNTLQSLAHQVNNINSGVIISMLDARRMEVYASVFDTNYNTLREIKAEVLTEESYKAYLENDLTYFIGSGVDKTKQLIEHKNAVYIDNKLPSAKEMAVISYDKFKKNDIEDVAYFEPYYLKDFIAIKPKSKF